MTAVLLVLVALLVAEFGVGLRLAWLVLGQLHDRQEVFNKYAKAVGRDSLTATREAAKALGAAQAAREDARVMYERVDRFLAEAKRG